MAIANYQIDKRIKYQETQARIKQQQYDKVREEYKSTICENDIDPRPQYCYNGRLWIGLKEAKLKETKHCQRCGTEEKELIVSFIIAPTSFGYTDKHTKENTICLCPECYDYAMKLRKEKNYYNGNDYREEEQEEE